MALVSRPGVDALRHSMAGLKPYHANGKRKAPSPLPSGVSFVFSFALFKNLLRHAMTLLLATSHNARAFMPFIVDSPNSCRPIALGHLGQLPQVDRSKTSQSPTATSRTSFSLN
jgi:hypothetical protein